MASSATNSCLTNALIDGKYQLGSMIGSGSFGEVYIGTEKTTGKEVAIKVEKMNLDKAYLEHEREVYSILEGQTGIPKLLWFGTGGDYSMMILEKLGPCLLKMFREHKKIFSLKTVLMIAEKMITCIEGMHDKGFIHRDITPSNICIGDEGNPDQLYLIDFGLAFQYTDPNSGRHCSKAMLEKYITTTLFASTRNEHLFQQARRDDLEALAYVLIYFQRGHLPWQSINGVNPKDTRRLRRNLKNDLSYEEIAKDCPAEFAEYLGYCRTLGFSDRPDYNYIRKLFGNLYDTNQYVRDSKFDWDNVTSPSACNAGEVQQ